MGTPRLLLLRIHNLIETTVADQSPMRQRQCLNRQNIQLKYILIAVSLSIAYGFLPHNGAVHLYHLSDVIGSRLELSLLHAFIDVSEELRIDITAAINA